MLINPSTNSENGPQQGKRGPSPKAAIGKSDLLTVIRPSASLGLWKQLSSRECASYARGFGLNLQDKNEKSARETVQWVRKSTGYIP